ncbi:MAG: hypothetical protein JO089_09375 [Alphaproteobacteria bacterium]|nr:hypothetical protein [Alphaproteobacteria bacterium]
MPDNDLGNQPDNASAAPKGSALLTVGKVVAAAGMAVGAVLLLTAVFGNPSTESVLNGIKGLFSSTPGETASIGAGIGKFLGDHLALTGAAALAASYVGYKQFDEQQEAIKDSRLPAMPRTSFAANVELEKIAEKQALIAARNQVYFGQPAMAPSRG